ncbi:MAG: S-layer homology domain-containing protein, partial [Clostridia bacterium]|nr:S-layer homology domain-containing protein [Clostridia bacterium]
GMLVADENSYRAAVESNKVDKIKFAGNITIPEGEKRHVLTRNLDIDLGGETLTLNSTCASIKVGTECALSLHDGKISAQNMRDPKGNLSGASSVYSALEKAAINVKNITMDTNGTAFFPYMAGAAVTIEDSDITGGGYCVGTNRSTLQQDIKINVKNSNLKTTAKDDAAIMINQPGDLTVEDGTITGNRIAILVRTGKANIKNVAITLTGNCENYDAYVDGLKWSDGANGIAGAIVVGDKSSPFKNGKGNLNNDPYSGDAKVTLENVTIDANGKRAIVVSDDDNTTSEVIVKSGTINGTFYRNRIKDTDTDTYKETGTIVVQGGTFTADPAAYVSTAYNVNKNAADNYVVTVKPTSTGGGGGGGAGGAAVINENGTPLSGEAKNEANVKPETTVEGGKAVANIDATNVEKAIESLNNNQSSENDGKPQEKTVVLDLSTDKPAGEVQTNLPAAATGKLADANVETVLQSSLGTLKISDEAMDSIVQQTGGQDVVVTIGTKTTEGLVSQVGSEKLAQAGLDKETLDKVSIIEVTIKAGQNVLKTYGGAKLTIAVPITGDQAVGSTYKVVAVSADGTIDIMTATVVLENGQKVGLIESNHTTTFIITNEEVKNKFTDVKASDYFYNAVLWAVSNNVTSGLTETVFGPNENCTRAQMVTFLWRAAGSPWASANKQFSDVPEGAYYKDAIEWAVAAGITSGISEDKFNPDGVVTREQLASFIYRYAQSKGQGFTGTWMFNLEYGDASSINSWADEAMHWCVMKGIITGTTKDTLSPQGTATRGQIMTMLYRYFSL